MTSMDAQEEYLASVKELHLRRLRLLDQQAARQGVSTPPEIIMEIEDIQAKINELDRRLAGVPIRQAGGTQSRTTKLLNSRVSWIVFSLLLLLIIGLGISLLRLISATNEKNTQLSLARTTETIQANEISALHATLTASTLSMTTTQQPVFFDNFKDKRPSDLIPLQFPQHASTISLTTTIEGGQYIIDAKNNGHTQQIYATNVEFQDFDLIIDVASIQGKGNTFITNFRVNRDKWGMSTNYVFQLVIDSKTAPYYRIVSHLYNNEGSHVYKTLKEDFTGVLTPLSQVRMKCKQEICEFYINGQRIYTDGGFRKVAGDIDFWIDGDFIIRLNSITINPN